MFDALVCLYICSIQTGRSKLRTIYCDRCRWICYCGYRPKKCWNELTIGIDVWILQICKYKFCPTQLPIAMISTSKIQFFCWFQSCFFFSIMFFDHFSFERILAANLWLFCVGGEIRKRISIRLALVNMMTWDLKF